MEEQNKLQPQVEEQINQTAVKGIEGGKGMQEVDEEMTEMKIKKIVPRSQKVRNIGRIKNT